MGTYLDQHRVCIVRNLDVGVQIARQAYVRDVIVLRAITMTADAGDGTLDRHPEHDDTKNKKKEKTQVYK